MEEYTNPHMEKWSEYTRQLAEALKNNEIEKAEELKALADSEYEEYKKFADKLYSCQNFGSCNEMFESALPTLFIQNRNAVQEITNLIKEDANLKAQFAFYNSLKNCRIEDVTSYINEAISLVENKIDYKTINKSNQKLINAIRKYGIVCEDKIDDKKAKLFESCDYILTHKKTIQNLNDYTENINTISKYINENRNLTENTSVNVFKLIEDYDKKYASLLNEDEKSFVQEIMDFRKNGNTSRKQSLFEKMKNECLNAVNGLIENATAEEKFDLQTIKEEINSKTFNEDTLVKDMAKLLELRDVLLEK